MKNLMSTLRGALSQGRVRSRHEYDFLPAYLEVVERPPSPLALRTALAITIFLLLAIAWSIFGKLDIHASATGQVIVSSRSKVIQPLAQGEVLDIYIEEGQRVKRGDLLLQLNPVASKAELERVKSKLEFVQLELVRYDALTTGKALADVKFPQEISTPLRLASRAALESDLKEVAVQLENIEAEIRINRANYAAAQNERADLAKLHSNVKARLNARRELEKSQAIARMDVLEIEKELLEVQRNQQLIASRFEVLNAENHKLTEKRRAYLAGKQRDFLHKRNELAVKLAELNQELVKATETNRTQSLRSPVDGTVQQLQVNTLGGVVQSADKLMVIVPDEAHLEVEAMLLNKDVGFVYSGQKVEIKLDAFPYTKYGTIPGTVEYVSRDAVKDEKLGFVFPVRIQLGKNGIDAEGKEFLIQPGMSVVAEIKTGQRRVISYVLSPLQQYQSEAMRER